MGRPIDIELNLKLQIDPDNLDLDTILTTQHKLYTIISQLNLIRNSGASINKLNPDILYNIFTYAIYTTEGCEIMKTALTISHICHRWRESALEWPTLWRYLDYSNSRELIELFLCRSKDTPLELSYDYVVWGSSKRRPTLESCANTTLSRLCYLHLRLPSSRPLENQHLFNNPELQPFQLRHLSVSLAYPERRALLTDFIRLDASYLESLYLDKMSLPCIRLPHNNVLSQFKFHPDNSPILSQLLTFLSSCSLLRQLELTIEGHPFEIETSASPMTIDTIDFPKLERLVLKTKRLGSDPSLEESRLNYIREFSAHVGNMGLLSHFALRYDNFLHWYEPGAIILPPSSTFGLVPQETFHHFPNQSHLSIELVKNSPTLSGRFVIFSAPRVECFNISSSSLCLEGYWGSNQLLNYAIVELIYFLPRVTHLRLVHHGLKYFIEWNFDFHHIFPCLDTLELVFPYEDNEDIPNSLPVNFPKVKRLILSAAEGSTPEQLIAFSVAATEVVELRDWSTIPVEMAETVSALRQRGVVVL